MLLATGGSQYRIGECYLILIVDPLVLTLERLECCLSESRFDMVLVR